MIVKPEDSGMGPTAELTQKICVCQGIKYHMYVHTYCIYKQTSPDSQFIALVYSVSLASLTHQLTLRPTSRSSAGYGRLLLKISMLQCP